MSRQSNSSDRKAIFSLWLGWMLSSGAITLVAVLSLWITRIWLPIVTFTLGLGLYLIVRRNREAQVPMCYVVIYIAMITMGISGLIMTIIDVINTPTLVSEARISSRASIVPYMGALIVYPIAALLYTYSAVRRYNTAYCRDCRRRFGAPAERGLIGMLFSQEGLYQRQFMAWLTWGMAIAVWAYYFCEYININLSQADVYIFVMMPALVFLLAGIYMGVRSMSIFYYYDRDIGGGFPRLNGLSVVRYIVICGNDILLNVPNPKDVNMVTDDKIDTPAKLSLPYRRHVSLSDARTWFLNMSATNRVDQIEVRFMYSTQSANSESNIFHYLAFVDSQDVLKNDLHGSSWFSIYEIDRMLREGLCNKLFAAEIVRLHRVAMAWKTYDREGRRLYKIKNYVPTFRVCDIHKWDVDYNDTHWLYVADNNEDKPFYRLRKAWRRYISGIND